MREVRCVFVFLVGVSGLLLFAAAASAQPSAFAGVDVVHDRCLANCFGLEDRAQSVACAIRCDNAAAMRPGADETTLSSEEYVERWGAGVIAAAGACNPTTPCPAEYGSCAGWSGYSSCGDTFCGIYRYCCELGPSGSASIPNCQDPVGEATKEYRERYRVCFNAAGQSCTEYQRTTVMIGCGCW